MSANESFAELHKKISPGKGETDVLAAIKITMIHLVSAFGISPDDPVMLGMSQQVSDISHLRSQLIKLTNG